MTLNGAQKCIFCISSQLFALKFGSLTIKCYFCSQNVYQLKILIMNRTIITVVGKDTVGIIAKVCTYLAENDINILDISQTIVQEYFNMMMIVDMGKMKKSFENVADELAEVGKGMGVQIKTQREEIFDMMHRI